MLQHCYQRCTDHWTSSPLPSNSARDPRPRRGSRDSCRCRAPPVAPHDAPIGESPDRPVATNERTLRDSARISRKPRRGGKRTWAISRSRNSSHSSSPSRPCWWLSRSECAVLIVGPDVVSGHPYWSLVTRSLPRYTAFAKRGWGPSRSCAVRAIHEYWTRRGPGAMIRFLSIGGPAYSGNHLLRGRTHPRRLRLTRGKT